MRAIEAALVGAGGRAGHPPAHDAPRPGRAAGRREDRDAAGRARSPRSPRDRRGRGAGARGRAVGAGDLPRARSGPDASAAVTVARAGRGACAATPGGRAPRSSSCSASRRTAGPIAELWFGAHPDDPSPVAGARHHAGRADRRATRRPLLGADVVARFGPRLPFLLKVLAADKALSMQVHPTSRRRRRASRAEDAAGVAARRARAQLPRRQPQARAAVRADAVRRAVRLPPGRRRPSTSLDALALPELDFLRRLLARAGPAARGVHRAAHPRHAGPLVGRRWRGGRAPADDGPLRGVAARRRRTSPATSASCSPCCSTTCGSSRARRSTSAPATCTAYLRGTGVEIMANSDNVLRCGLTPSTSTSPSCSRSPTSASSPSRAAAPSAACSRCRCPTSASTRLELGRRRRMALDDPGPSIVLCTAGEVQVGDVALRARAAAFVGAGTRDDAGRHGAGVRRRRRPDQV